MMIERKETNRGGAPSVRSILACVLALVVIFQGVAAIGSPVARSARDHGQRSLMVSVLGVGCAVNAPDGDHLPAHERSNPQCCVLCGARDVDGVAPSPVAQTSGAIAPPPARVVIWRHFAAPRVAAPTGWVSSWSSQAPPTFS